MLMFIYCVARLADLKRIGNFTDWWISGRGKAKGVPGAVDDCFISPGQHKKYILKYRTLICIDRGKIVGWAVVQNGGTLIHILVAGDSRCLGIGKTMMKILSPRYVRSKKDQSTGNPFEFYESLGYRKIRCEQSRSRFDIDEIRPTRRPNIDIFEYPGKLKPDPRRVDFA